MIEKKVLVVDDEKQMRNALKTFLTKKGYQVKVVDGSEKALKLMKNENFPVILTDIRMPNMDGIKLCQTIRRRNSWSVILALSGYITEYEQKKITECGFDGYINKPANSSVLKDAIDVAFHTAVGRMQ